MKTKFAAFFAAMAWLLLGTTLLPAHEGHDHGEAPPVIATVAPRAEASSETFELVAVRRGADLEIWLDRFATNEPVVSASIEVETPDGPATAKLSPDGVYRLPAPWMQKPGPHDLIFTIADGSDVDVLAATLTIPAPAPAPAPPVARTWLTSLPFSPAQIGSVAAFAAGALLLLMFRPRPLLWLPVGAIMAMLGFGVAQLVAKVRQDVGAATADLTITQDRAQIAPDGSVFAPKATQRILDVRTAMSEVSPQSKTIELPGRILADPNGSGQVQASVTGRLSAPPDGFPRLGARVRKGQVLAFVTTPFTAMDQSTMRQQAGDLNQQISVMERRLARSEALARTGSVAAAALEELRIELDGLRDRRAALDDVKREPEALVAPIDGVIASVHAVAGLIAEPNTVLFTIMQPDRLWVEALAFEPPPPGVTATASTPDSRVLTLDFVGAGLADRNQAVPVHFAIRNAQDVRPGQFVTVSVGLPEVATGIALPRTSVVRRSNGETVAYEHIRAEHFESRLVRIAPLDAGRVLVVGGLTAGKRIVTDAAELLNQVR
jgi:cobalt-zinc-cadmium efflux system membrane fusion protein